MRGADPAPDWVWERYTPGHAGGGFTDSGPQAQRIQSRERSSAKRCGSERLPQHNAVPPPVSTLRAHSLQPGAPVHRVDRSLWPEFWRIPAPVRGSEPLACKHRLGNAFRAASGAARSAAGASGCHSAFPPEPRRLDVGRPRRERAVATAQCRSTPCEHAPRPQLATQLGGPAHGPLTLAGILANSGPRSRLRTIGVQTLPWQRIQSRERSSAKRCGSERLPQRVSAGASAAGRGPPPAGASGCHSTMPFHPL